MRTEQQFNEVWFDECIKRFTPRIQTQLKNLPFPEDLYGEVESAFIYGSVSTGKTIRAAFMMLQEMKNCYLRSESHSVYFVSFPELFAEIKETFNNMEKRESEVLKRYLNVNLLVIDDFLSCRPTEWVMDTLYYLINHRYEYMKKTIITSNYSLQELEKRMNDQRITSRINAMCIIEEKKRTWK